LNDGVFSRALVFHERAEEILALADHNLSSPARRVDRLVQYSGSAFHLHFILAPPIHRHRLAAESRPWMGLAGPKVFTGRQIHIKRIDDA
jgi:hypothetical protein